MSSSLSICVLRLSAIGDVCHAVAVVQAIQKHYPSAEITWVVGRLEASLLKQLPGIRFVVFDKSTGLEAYRQLRRNLPETFDVLLHMQVALRANIAAACIRAKRKIGFPKHLSKELHSLVINECITLPAQPHVLDGFAGFAHALAVPPFHPEWRIPLAEDDLNWAATVITTNRPLLAVSPAASKAERNWLPERYAAVIDHAFKRGYDVVLTGGPTTMAKSLAQDIMAACINAPTYLVGQSTLTQLLALLKRADVVLSPDSGPAHMATTQGTPVIGLYAHSNPARTGPYLSQATMVEVYHHHLYLQHGKTANALPWGARVKGEHLMADITVDQVIACFDRIIDGVGEHERE